MNKVIYKITHFEGMWFLQRISDGKIIKRLFY